MTEDLFNLLIKVLNKKALKEDEELFLQAMNYIDDNRNLTAEAFKVLEPYKVKRAVIMAAGFGSRMVPVTLKTPKPLVRVNGTRIIETLLNKIIKAGIKEIYIIRGYLKDQFDVLLEKYPFIKFIDNDLFDKENNISSAIKAIDLFDNTYFCEADFICKGTDIIKPYQYFSNYLGTPVKSTDDWCFDVDNENIISNYRKGGTNCVQAFGISYWNHEDGLLLQSKLKEMYQDKSTHNEFWEMCIFSFFKNDFKIKCRYCKKESILEIDSFKELCEVDNSYINFK